MPDRKKTTGKAGTAGKARTKRAAPAGRAREAAPTPPADAAPAPGTERKGKAKEARLRVKQVRSGIGHAATYRRTLAALGLRHHQAEAVVRDNPSMRGMLHKVRHLVRVIREEA